MNSGGKKLLRKKFKKNFENKWKFSFDLRFLTLKFEGQSKNVRTKTNVFFYIHLNNTQVNDKSY